MDDQPQKQSRMCRFFNGVINILCRANVRYSDVEEITAEHGLRRPCIKRRGQYDPDTCQKRKFD